MINVGYKFRGRFEPSFESYSEGANAFVRWLDQLRAIPAFDTEWFAQWEEHGPRTFFFADPERYVRAFVDRYDTPDRVTRAIWAHDVYDDPDQHKFAARMSWGGPDPAILEMDLHRADPRFGTEPEQYVELIRMTTVWQRILHLSFGPTFYHFFDHPLDRSRHGIGWMGWLPFTLTPADVPEAHLVMPMNGGTFIQSVPDFWQAPHLPRQPDAVRDEATIARVQDVEIRLNLLGVLPTADDLRGGNWGR